MGAAPFSPDDVAVEIRRPLRDDEKRHVRVAGVGAVLAVVGGLVIDVDGRLPTRTVSCEEGVGRRHVRAGAYHERRAMRVGEVAIIAQEGGMTDEGRAVLHVDPGALAGGLVRTHL